MTAETKLAIIKLYKAGYTQTEIARMFELPNPMVRDALVFSGENLLMSDFDRANEQLCFDAARMRIKMSTIRQSVHIGDSVLVVSPRINSKVDTIPVKSFVIDVSHPRFVIVQFEKSKVLESICWEDLKPYADGRSWWYR